MKKILVAAAALVIGMGNLFAWTNIIQLGVKGAFPEYITTTGSNAENYKFNSTGIDLGYIGTFDCGLSIKADVNCGFGSAKSPYLSNLENVELGPVNFNSTESIGAGYSIINNDILFLGAYGNIGWSNNFALTAKQAEDKAFAYGLYTESFFVGGEVVAVYTPVKVFSLYASLSANVAFGSVARASGSVKITDVKGKEEVKPDVSDKSISLANPYLLVKPSIGIAWKF